MSIAHYPPSYSASPTTEAELSWFIEAVNRCTDGFMLNDQGNNGRIPPRLRTLADIAAMRGLIRLSTTRRGCVIAHAAEVMEQVS